MSQRKRRHLKSPQCQFPLPRGHIVVVFYIRASYWLPSMTIGPPIPEIQFDLENSRSKADVKSTPVSPASWSLISWMFHIRASYRLLSPLFHDIWGSHSWDTIWPWKFKVKGQGQRYPSQRSIQMTHFLSVSHLGILSTPVPFVPWQLGLPFPKYTLTLKIQGQRSKGKVKVKGTLVSVASSWLICFLFHINWTNHS